ncbi:MAG: hypothetical protein E7625_04190 [Ruminococcaceae bacterium]|nr:hypothetical protein [Oscillospiraceae bacterium]
MKIYSMSKADVMDELNCHPHLLHKTVAFCKSKNKNLSDEQARLMAQELIYQECRKKFDYNEYVRSASDALNHISKSTSNFSKMLDDAATADEIGQWLDKRQEKARDKNLNRLKKKCNRSGLDFNQEQKKYVKKQKILDFIIICTWIISFVGFLVSLFINGIAALICAILSFGHTIYYMCFKDKYL